MDSIYIKNKADYKCFIAHESRKHGMVDYLFPNPTKSFVKSLRRYEYHSNCKGFFHKIMSVVCFRRYLYWSLKTGISIPRNVFDKGLSIPHYGSIVVNANSRIGKNCRIHNNVNIGSNGGEHNAPQIGNNVYIGPGAVIYGDIYIADCCYIGANSVVNKSFPEPFSVIAGVPARVVSMETKCWWEKNA